MVSPLGLGTVKLGRDRGVRYASAFVIPDDAQAADLLRLAQKLGVTLLDTAPAYGESEARLGRILGSCGGRDRWTIVTKVGESFDPERGESSYDFSAEAVRRSVEQSLRRLRVNHVDIVLLHSDGRDGWVLRESGALDALARLKKKGLTRLVGISAKEPPPGGAMLAARGDGAGPMVDVVMVALSAGDTSQLEAIRAASDAGVGVLIKKAFGGGADPPGEALRRCLAEPGVSSVVVGTIDRAHLEANARVVEGLLRAR
jgi:aryl-alcohol dehydrogenase-like predicted oxidoreductase